MNTLTILMLLIKLCLRSFIQVFRLLKKKDNENVLHISQKKIKNHTQ